MCSPTAAAPPLPLPLVVLALLLLGPPPPARAMGDFAGDADSFPGWLGASSNSKRPRATADATQEPPQEAGAQGIDQTKVVRLSAWKPRAYLYKGFLSEVECDHILEKATPRLRRSLVVNNENGGGELSDVRTSSGAGFGKGEDAVLQRIEERIQDWTFLPRENQEPLQVLRYDVGQKYEPHFDYFHDELNTRMGGNRYATVLMYLNDVELGGETVFPNHEDPTPKDDTWSDCAKGYLAVKPRKGDAVLFFGMHPDGTLDDSSLHYACPVVKGVKWSAPMWIHVADRRTAYEDKKSAEPEEDTGDDGSGCSDTTKMCQAWAKSGECKRNPAYMLLSCKKSCHTCKGQATNSTT